MPPMMKPSVVFCRPGETRPCQVFGALRRSLTSFFWRMTYFWSTCKRSKNNCVGWYFRMLIRDSMQSSHECSQVYDAKARSNNVDQDPCCLHRCVRDILHALSCRVLETRQLVGRYKRFFCFFRQARMGQVCPAFDFPSSRLCSGSNNTTDHSPSICRLFVLHSFHRVRNRRQRIDSRKRRNPQRVGYNRSNARPCPTSLLSILPAGISYFYPLQTAQTGEESSQSPRTRRMRPQRDSAV